MKKIKNERGPAAQAATGHMIDEYLRRNRITPAMLGEAMGTRYPSQAMSRWRRNMPDYVALKLRELERSGYWDRDDVREAERVRLEEAHRRTVEYGRKSLTPEILRDAQRKGTESRRRKP